MLNVANNARSILTQGIMTADPIDVIVTAGDGDKFPADNFRITIDDEILHCTSRTGDTLTCTRGAEGTSVTTHCPGSSVELRITAGIIQEIQDAIEALE